MRKSPTRSFQLPRLRPFVAVLACCLLAASSGAGAVTISNVPLYLGTSTPPNVLFILANSQNMDENGDPSQGMIGAAVGASSPYSKSEIARAAIRNLESTYIGQINLGLMTFAQSNISKKYMYNSFYDASYDPANYNPSYVCPSGTSPLLCRASTTKLYSTPNPVSPGNNIYYNYASPFYDTSGYPANFCYSNTAKFDDTTNITSYDKYRCFLTKTGTSDGIVSPLPTSSSATAAEQAYGYSGSLLYQGAFSPTDSDYANNALDFGARVPSVYAAMAWFSNGSPGGGYLQVPLAALTSTQQTTINNKLTCNIPAPTSSSPTANPTPTSGTCNNNSSPTSSSILNAGLTAIEGTLNDAASYFKGTLGTSKGAPSGYTLPNSCNKNFVVLLTNGLPSVDASGTVETTGSGQVDTCSMTAKAITAAGNLYSGGAGPKLYMVGYALPPFALTNYNTTCGVSGNPLDNMASAGGTGTSFSASNPTALQSALNSVFTSILQAAGSSSALTSNSTSINSNSYVYQASFNTADWSGHLQAVPVGVSGNGAASWDAATLIPTWSNRDILTYNDSTGAGAAFQWSGTTSISANEQCLLAGQPTGCTLSAAQTTTGQQVLNYISGDTSLDQAHGGTLRNRSVLLGDIVDSNPLYLSADDYGYSVLAGSEGSTYAAYVAAKTTQMLYAGANDGMLHGFNATTGVEQFAYVPSAVYAKLPALTQPSYNANHQYYVDGSPGSGDAYYSGTWHTVLIGTLGSGGTPGSANGVFALDISNPTAMTASKVLWEFTDANDLGVTWGQPSVWRFNDGNYYAVVNNGYNSVNGHAVLFLIQVNNPSNVIKLDAGSGGTGCTADGLSQPTLLDADHNGTVDAIYAGDLCGNVWKFDVSNTLASKWKVAFTSGSGSSAVPAPLFTAKDGSGNRQPITAPLALGTLPTGVTGTTLVFFGTGQYLGSTDTTSTSTQSLYGVLDSSTFSGGAFSGGASSLLRSNLVQQSILYQGALNSSTGYQSRGVSTNSVTYPSSGTDYGWYMDLLPPSGPAQGERVISAPIFRSGRILFATMIPSSGTCVSGGTGWLMELDGLTGGAPNYTFLDFNGDGQYNSSDNITANGASYVAVGVQMTQGFSKTPVSMSGPNQNSSTTCVSSSNGTVSCSKPPPSCAPGSNCSTNIPFVYTPTANPRASWNQIQ